MNFIDKSINFRIFSLVSTLILIDSFHENVPNKQDYDSSNKKVKHLPCVVIGSSTGSLNIRNFPLLKSSLQSFKGALLLIVTEGDKLVNSVVVYLKTISRFVLVELED